MAAPAGTRANRWGQVVSAVAAELGWTADAADVWLNGVWATMYSPDESFGDAVAHGRLRRWLETNVAGAPTLPEALRRYVV